MSTNPKPPQKRKRPEGGVFLNMIVMLIVYGNKKPPTNPKAKKLHRDLAQCRREFEKLLAKTEKTHEKLLKIQKVCNHMDSGRENNQCPKCLAGTFGFRRKFKGED